MPSSYVILEIQNVGVYFIKHKGSTGDHYGNKKNE